MDSHEEKQLIDKARQLRRLTIECIGHLGVGHIGGSLSIVEILTILYYREMKGLDPANPKDTRRDVLVLSKGHGSPALYAVLSDKGFIPDSWLQELNQGGKNLPSHCDMRKTPGVDFTTGSLGQGLSAAAGIALARRMKQVNSYTFLILGDGEIQEGQIWEAAMFASHYKLDHLIAFLDFNHMQFDGTTNEVISLGNVEKKWRSFGWHVQKIDGHSFQELSDAVKRARKNSSKPSMIICDTVKAKGYIYGEGKVDSHNMSISKLEMREALRALDAGEEQE